MLLRGRLAPPSTDAEGGNSRSTGPALGRFFLRRGRSARLFTDIDAPVRRRIRWMGVAILATGWLVTRRLSVLDHRILLSIEDEWMGRRGLPTAACHHKRGGSSRGLTTLQLPWEDPLAGPRFSGPRETDSLSSLPIALQHETSPVVGSVAALGQHGALSGSQGCCR